MQQISAVLIRKEYVFFDLARCINELPDLCDELSAQDMNEIRSLCKKLRYFIEDKKPQLNLA